MRGWEIRDLSDGERRALGCFEDGARIGYIAARETGERTAELISMETRPDARGRGVGRCLLRAAAKAFPNRTLVAQTDEAAAGFFRKHGFSVEPRGGGRYLCARESERDASETPRVLRKTMAREDWKRLVEREYRWQTVKDADFDGEAALIRVVRVSAPLVRRLGTHTVRILDDGYLWLQLAPRGGHWWLSAMFDDTGALVQYYFDITRENLLTGDGNSHFRDLLLDVVAMPDGETLLLDADELALALEGGEVTRAEYDAAYRVADELRAWIRDSLPEIERMVRKYAQMP